ncbi:MAG: TIGR04086 family membrane protein [Hungatella sp.]|jgi:putative membrane protein (TIGR04086 family)|nr:TIGR04086 family membrane protein [Hungatella sp.]
METSSTPRVLLRSLLFSYLLSGILLVVTSFVLYKFRLKESQVKMAVNAIYLLSCALAGFLMGKGLKKQRFFCGLLAGLSYFLILLAVSFAINKGLTADTAQILTTLAFCAGSGIIGGVSS